MSACCNRPGRPSPPLWISWGARRSPDTDGNASADRRRPD